MKAKEFISNKQGITLIILFINGSATIFVQGISAKSDLWLAFLIGVVMSFPLILMFSRLLSLFPERNLFDITEICFGKYFGKVLVLFFTWHCFYAVVVTLEDLGFFFRTNLFTETPGIVIMILFILPCAYAAKLGIEVLARWSEIFIPVTIFVVFSIFLLLLPKMEWSYLTPVLYQGMKPVIQGAFSTLTFPFAYTVGTLLVFTLTKERNSPYKIYFTGFFIGAAILFVIYLGIIVVLGPFNASAIYYPTYTAVSLISIGSFLQRLDILAAIVYLIGIFVQVNIFLLGSCKGLAKLFYFPDYRFIVWPITFLMVTVAVYEPGSIMHYFEFQDKVWPYYILPFEIILPFLIWIVAEIRVRNARKQGQTLGQGNKV